MTEQEVIKEPWQTEVNAENHVHTNGQYTNLILNDYKGQVGIKGGDWIKVRKHNEFNGPYTQEKEGQYGKYNMHMMKVMVGDQEASFVSFSDQEAEAFENVAGLGDLIGISKKKYTYVDKRGIERVKEELVFKKLE